MFLKIIKKKIRSYLLKNSIRLFNLFTTFLRHFAIKIYQSMRQFDNMHLLKTLYLCVFETVCKSMKNCCHILSRYVAFTKVYNEQVKRYGRSREAVTETIRICKDRNLLREFLESREKEVVSIMMTLFDEERIMRNYVASERREAVRDAVENMLKTGKMSAEEIAGYFTELSVEDVREIEKELLQTI